MNDRSQWRRRATRQLLGYALLLPVLVALLLWATWTLRHKVIHMLSTNPRMALEIISGNVIAVVGVIYAVYILLSARRSMLRHDKNMTRAHGREHIGA